MKNVLTTSLLLVATAITSSTLHAHENNNCDIEIEGGINISSQSIEFVDDDKNTLYLIENDKILFIEGEKTELSKEQQVVVAQYATKIRGLVPEVKSLALDAVSVASDGVNLAFTELLGEGNKVSSDITAELDTIHQQIETHFSAEAGISIDKDGLNGDDIFGDNFEERIESVVENAIQSSMGALMVAVGQQMLSSGGDMDAFGNKMERFGEKIEYELETRGEALEERANNLCKSVVELDELEAKLHSSIKSLADYDFLEASYKDNHNKTSI